MTGQYVKVVEKKLVRTSPTTKRRKKFARSHLEVHMFNVKEGEVTQRRYHSWNAL